MRNEDPNDRVERRKQLQLRLVAKHGSDSRIAFNASNALAEALERASRFEEASSVRASMLDYLRNKFGNDSRLTLNEEIVLACDLRDAGKFGEAYEYACHVHGALLRSQGPAHADTIWSADFRDSIKTRSATLPAGQSPFSGVNHPAAVPQQTGTSATGTASVRRTIRKKD